MKDFYVFYGYFIKVMIKYLKLFGWLEDKNCIKKVDNFRKKWVSLFLIIRK